MTRPDFITDEHINRYNETIKQDPIAKQFLEVPLMMEVCYAGCYLEEELIKLGCPENLMVRICFEAGRMSFGRDPWEAHLQILEEYKNDTLEYEAEINPLELN